MSKGNETDLDQTVGLMMILFLLGEGPEKSPIAPILGTYHLSLCVCVCVLNDINNMQTTRRPIARVDSSCIVA